MDFDHFLQSLHSYGQKVPDGFAVVPLPIFLMLTNQWPHASQMQVQPVVSSGPWNASLYERAMAVSSN